MRLLRILCLLAALPFVGCDPIYLIEPSDEEVGTLHEGTITRDEVWREDDNPHRVMDQLVVAGPNGPTLTLEPGVRVLFARNAALYIGSDTEPGSLRAVGSGDDRIELMSRLQYQFHGYWGALHFAPTAGPSRLEHVTIRDCGGTSDWPPACLRILGSNQGRPHPVVRDVLIAFSSGYGIAAVGRTGLGDGSANIDFASVRGYPFRVGADRLHTVSAGGSFTAMADPAIEVGGGVVAESQHWPDLGLPYVVTGPIRVGGTAAPTLEIPAGTRWVFGRNGEILVGMDEPGRLVAEGTADAPVVFTSAGQSPRDWNGLTFGAAALPGSRLSHTVLEYGGQPNGYSVANVTFFTDIGPVLRNSTIRHSSGCGIARLAFGGEWGTDFTDPVLGNRFSDNHFGPQCTQQ